MNSRKRKLKLNFRILLIPVICLTAFLFSCEKRTDFLKDMETAAAKPPQIAIRRLNSINPYAQTFSDTSLIGLQGYKLQYQITGAYDASTIKLTCETKCDSIINVIAHPDSSYFAVFIKPSSTVSWQLTVNNKYNQSATAYFALTFKNSKPVVNIRKSGPNTYGKILHDTCFYALSSNYNIDFTYTDDNSNYTNLTVLKATTGDNSIITITNGHININYGSANTNANNVYKIYGEDPLAVTSDTCYAYITYYNKTPVLYIVNQAGNNIYSQNDSLKTTVSSSYSLNVKISDETATISNMNIIRITSGDNSVITKSGNYAYFNYTTAGINKLYQYKMYVTDGLGLSSDTCYFNVYTFKNRPPVFVNAASQNLGSAVNITSIQAPYYFNINSYSANGGCAVTYTNIPANANAAPANLTINAYDPDAYSFGGFIQKIKYIFYSTSSYGTCSTGCYNRLVYKPTQTTYFGSVQSSYLLSTYTVNGISWWDQLNCYGLYHYARYDIVLYDNDGDSTVVPQFGVQY